jgi:hypothetical protein
VISNFSELQHLASYVSRHNAMAYGSHQVMMGTDEQLCVCLQEVSAGQ